MSEETSASTQRASNGYLSYVRRDEGNQLFQRFVEDLNKVNGIAIPWKYDDISGGEPVEREVGWNIQFSDFFFYFLSTDHLTT